MIQYRVGDATATPTKRVIIAHCCNDVGAWGAGFVIPLAERYPQAKKMYRIWNNRGTYIDDTGRDIPFFLGEAQFCRVEPEVYVANIIGQAGVFGMGNIPPIRYEAIRKGLATISEIAISKGYTVQMPKMGSGLAGGDWKIIEKIIEEELTAKGVETVVLTLEVEDFR